MVVDAADTVEGMGIAASLLDKDTFAVEGVEIQHLPVGKGIGEKIVLGVQWNSHNYHHDSKKEYFVFHIDYSNE